MTNARCPISILIPARNEAANLRACLESCRFADEVVVVDSQSTDGTPAIAREFGAAIVDFAWNGRFPKKKNWSLANVHWRNDWVFILDADERIPAELAHELAQVVAAPDCDAYFVNRRFWFLDGWLKHCGYYPSWNIRFFRHATGRFEEYADLNDTGSGDNEVHEHVIVNGKLGRLRHDLDHYAFPTIDIWVEKHNRYANWEARVLASAAGRQAAMAAHADPTITRRRRLKRIAAHLPFRPSLRFIYHYVLRAGFMDGYRGYVFCRLMAFYEFLSLAKAEELRRRPLTKDQRLETKDQRQTISDNGQRE